MSTLMQQYQNYSHQAYAHRKSTWGISEQILFEIVDDMLGRRGLRQEFESYDELIQDEILAEWLAIIEDRVDQAYAERP